MDEAYKAVDVAIVGAGPAGLTAAYLLSKQGYSITVIEKDPVYVGGISRTVQHQGFPLRYRRPPILFEIEGKWSTSGNEILPDDFIQRPRMSRIYYEGKFYSYPLRAFEALRNLGLWRSGLCMLSYARWKAAPKKDVASFQDWVINQVRAQALLDLLQDLHRKGVGYAVRRDFPPIGQHNGSRGSASAPP